MLPKRLERKLTLGLQVRRRNLGVSDVIRDFEAKGRSPL